MMLKVMSSTNAHQDFVLANGAIAVPPVVPALARQISELCEVEGAAEVNGERVGVLVHAARVLGVPECAPVTVNGSRC